MEGEGEGGKGAGRQHGRPFAIQPAVRALIDHRVSL